MNAILIRNGADGVGSCLSRHFLLERLPIADCRLPI
jgi:hypothetical protein